MVPKAKGIWIRLLWKRENSWLSLPTRGSLVAFNKTTWLSSEIKREFKRGICWLEQLGIELSWDRSSESIVKLALCLEWERMLSEHVFMLCIGWSWLEFHGSLNDDGESNVLEVIQNLELLADLRETSWRKVDVVLIGLDVVGHGLN